MKWNRTGAEEVCMIEEQNGVSYMTLKGLRDIPWIRHMFTTRMGGVSQGDCESMNLNFAREESRENVLENYRRIGKILGVETDHFILSDQTHTTNVRRMTKEDAGKGVVRERDYSDVDGMITNDPGIVLTTIYADCVPLYFVDTVHKAVGVSHSGWKGTVNRMGKATIQAMETEFGTQAKDLITAIGPSICMDCYEVSKDVAEQFVREQLAEGIVFPKKNGQILLYQEDSSMTAEKYQLNLWEANRRILLEAGVEEKNIHVTDICTCCNPDKLFSHRASHGKRGNLAAMIEIV